MERAWSWGWCSPPRWRSRGLAPGLRDRTERLLTLLGITPSGDLPSAAEVLGACASTRSTGTGSDSFSSRRSAAPSWSTMCPTRTWDPSCTRWSARMKVLYLFGPNLGTLGASSDPLRVRDPPGDHDVGRGAGRGVGPRDRLAAVRPRGRPGRLALGAAAEGVGAVVINPARSPTTPTRSDAIETSGLPAIEVHMSNTRHARTSGTAPW